MINTHVIYRFEVQDDCKQNVTSLSLLADRTVAYAANLNEEAKCFVHADGEKTDRKLLQDHQ